jgi:hypothetical protein
MPRPAWTVILIIVVCCITGMTGVCCCTQPLVKMESCELFWPKQASNCNHPNIHSQVARITVLSHHTWLKFYFWTCVHCIWIKSQNYAENYAKRNLVLLDLSPKLHSLHLYLSTLLISYLSFRYFCLQIQVYNVYAYITCIISILLWNITKQKTQTGGAAQVRVSPLQVWSPEFKLWYHQKNQKIHKTV